MGEENLSTELTLPWPPTVNTYWRVRVNGKYPTFFVAQDGIRYRRNVQGYCLAWKVKPIKGRVRIVVDAYPPDRRVRDLDNVLKALLDSLRYGGAYLDDGQIDHLTVIRREKDGNGGRVVVRLEEIPE